MRARPPDGRQTALTTTRPLPAQTAAAPVGLTGLERTTPWPTLKSSRSPRQPSIGPIVASNFISVLTFSPTEGHRGRSFLVQLNILASQPGGVAGAVFGNQSCGDPYHGWDDVVAKFISELFDRQAGHIGRVENSRGMTSKNCG
jgi:hypothetical protein